MSASRVADFIAAVRCDDLPCDVLDQAKRAIRDTIGVMVAAHEDTAVKAARRGIILMGGREESTLIGMGTKVPSNLAAFVNAVMASTLDMDDGSFGLMGHTRLHRCHAGGIVIPAALAVAERLSVTGKEFLEAVVAGYEVTLATAWMIGKTTGKTVLAARTGTYGAAAAAAKLLGLSQKEMLCALNIAEAHCPFPSYAFIWNRTDMTKEASAWASMTGVTAALLAQAGFCGAPTIYDSTEYDQEPIEELGREWEIMSLYFKLYSACRCSHAALDGLFEIVREHNLDAESISNIIVGCSRDKSLNMNNYRPTNIWQAQYSIPFVVGAALVDGVVGPNQISGNRLDDKAILKQADKVEMVADAEVDACLPGMFAGRTTIVTRDNRKFECFVQHPKGDPENPLSEEELLGKFKRLTANFLKPYMIEILAKEIHKLEGIKEINELVEKVAHLDKQKT